MEAAGKLTIEQVQESFPEAYARMKAAMVELHSEYLETYQERYGVEPVELLLNLHTNFYQTKEALVAVEPHGGLLHWNPSISNWIPKGDISVN